MLKANLNVRIDSLVISAFLALVIYSFLPLHLLWDFFPETVNEWRFLLLYFVHVIFLVLGVLFVQQKSSTLGKFLLTSIMVFFVLGVVSWVSLTFWYEGSVGSGLRIYFVMLPVIFSFFNGFHGSLIKNMIRYVGLFCTYALLLILA
jgi:hypothetical protein